MRSQTDTSGPTQQLLKKLETVEKLSKQTEPPHRETLAVVILVGRSRHSKWRSDISDLIERGQFGPKWFSVRSLV
jgi:hypothetical protein